MPKRLPHLKIGSFWMFASCGMKYSLRSSRSPEKPSLVSLPYPPAPAKSTKSELKNID